MSVYAQGIVNLTLFLHTLPPVRTPFLEAVFSVFF
jgi:hypothetical protein